MRPWSFLKFWDSGECQVVMEKLDDLQTQKTSFSPARKDLFRSLSHTNFDTVKCMVVGQDPYPNIRHATGIAFEIPANLKQEEFPPTLQNIFKEYHEDLGYPEPTSGSLKKWTDQGVLLWNAIPTCIQGKPLSCESWTEWQWLTKEIIEQLSPRAIVFVFLGRVAREYSRYVSSPSISLEYSHPSPRGNLNSRTPFLGSRLFSTINAKLVEQSEQPIDWRLE